MIKTRTRFIFIVLIITVGFAVYGNSLTNAFLWDDELLIISNDYIKDSHHLPTLFTTHIAYGANEKSNFYRPLQMLTYALNFAVGKFDVRVYHLTNIGLHILVALGLYWLTRLITKSDVLSLISSLLFISHPIHTEAVSYISGRADPLTALFMLLALIFYIKYQRNDEHYLFYSLSIGFFALALLSKEIAIVLPLLLLAYDYIYKTRKGFSFKMHLPFLALGSIYIVLRKTILDFPIQRTIIDKITFSQRVPAIFKSLTMYFKKLLFPLNLHMEYEIIAPPITDIQVILGMVIVLILILVPVMYRKRKKIISFSIVWFLINYLPISNIYPLNAFFAEHWIYTASFGLFILAGWLTVKIWQRGPIFKQLTCLFLAFLLTCNFRLTMKQNQYWKNAEHFYKRTLKYAPHSRRVYYRLGLVYLRQGLIDKGIKNLEESLAISPDYTPAYQSLTTAYIFKGAYDQAIDLSEKILKIEPDSDTMHNNLGIAYSLKGWDEQALGEFKKAVSINPSYVGAYNNLGIAYAVMGMQEEAKTAFRNALEINPTYAGAHQNFARAYYDAGQYNLAIQHCDRAIELGSSVPPEFLNLLKPHRK